MQKNIKNILFSALLLFGACQKKQIKLVTPNAITEKSQRVSLSFSRFGKSCYFWSNPADMQDAGVAFSGIAVNGALLSGTHKVVYGLYDNNQDTLLTKESSKIYFGTDANTQGAAFMSVDLEDMLLQANQKNKEGLIYVLFKIPNKNSEDTLYIKLNTLVKKQAVFELTASALNFFEDESQIVELELDLPDHFFNHAQARFYIKVNDAEPVQKDFVTYADSKKGYLVFGKNEFDLTQPDVRLTIWHQMNPSAQLFLANDIGKEKFKTHPQRFCSLLEQQGATILSNRYPFSQGKIKVVDNKVLSVDISSKNLSKVPNEIFCLTDLEELVLDNNAIGDLPPSIIEPLKKLKVLSVQQNNLYSLPLKLWQLSQLQILRLNNNKINAIPKQINQLNNLNALAWSYNGLTTQGMPDSLNVKIEHIELSGNSLDDAVIGRLPKKAKTLYLAENQLTKNALSKLGLDFNSTLQKLDVRKNLINVLPDNVQNNFFLLKLNFLDISGHTWLSYGLVYKCWREPGEYIHSNCKQTWNDETKDSLRAVSQCGQPMGQTYVTVCGYKPDAEGNQSALKTKYPFVIL